MRSVPLKTGYFILEGLNSFATVYYAYYLYFFMQKAYGFGNKANLALAAFNGLVCMVAAWWGGRFAQRFGYFTALKLGFGTMAVVLLLGSQLHSAPGQIFVMAVFITGMCLTWPTLEAIISEGETPARLPHMIGLYNIVWAAMGAVAYFSGGAMLDKLGLQSMFYVPAAIEFSLLCMVFWLESKAGNFGPASPQSSGPEMTPPQNPRPIAKARMFLRMAWLANPFAYIAINTLIAVIPGVARNFELSTTLAGFCCSVWCFARLGAFIGLWFWTGWHHRFRWLLASYLALMGAFAGILLAPNVAFLVLAQIIFGGATGLIYYSSLFYSMHSSDTKGEHGGIHEAAIGLGNFAGPAVGAASLFFLPGFAYSNVLAVSALLLAGLGGLMAIWRQGKGE
jgi:predicted MFS family arabinose efflux permease